MESGQRVLKRPFIRAFLMVYDEHEHEHEHEA